MNDCAMSKFSKSRNPRNIDKSFSDVRISIRFTFESSFWISVSGCKLTILPDIRIRLQTDYPAGYPTGKPDSDNLC